MGPEYSSNPKDSPKFSDPDSATMKRLMDKLPQFLHNIAAILQIKDANEILVCQESLYEICTRIEKRRVYFHIYHNGLKMGERNEGALVCFWILKLMPFKHDIIPNSLLNTKIAFTFFLNMLYYEASKVKKHVNVKSSLYNQLLYAFMYRDLSKEAIMALAESLLY